MEYEGRDRAIAFVARGIFVIGITIGWWIVLVNVYDWVARRDGRPGNEIGTDTTTFRYDLLFLVLFTLPAFAIPAWHAIRRRYMRELVGALVVLWSANTLWYFVKRGPCPSWSDSTSGLAGDADGVVGIALAIVTCLIAGIALGRRDQRAVGESLAVASALGASTSLISFLQWASCMGMSAELDRGVIVLLFPFLAALAFPVVWIGGLIGGRLRPVRGPRPEPAPRASL